METVEMHTLSDLSRVTEKLADFAGNILMQLMQKQGYVEEQDMKALLTHIRAGGQTRTTTVSEQRAEDFKELLKKAHIPYVEIEHMDATTKERSMFFIYRDIDEAKVKDVIRQFEIRLDQDCHEVDLDTFEKMMDKQTYSAVYGLSKEEIEAFREAVRDYNLMYSVVADGHKYAVIGNDKEMLEDAIMDTCYNLSGERGASYMKSIRESFARNDDFLNRMKPEPGMVKYVVSGTHPENFITVDEQGITTHSIGVREEMQKDGSRKQIVYDMRHVSYPGFDKERLNVLALELGKPMIFDQADFSLVTGLSKTKEAILSPSFVENYETLKAQLKFKIADIKPVPKRKPMYEREALIGYTNVPSYVLEQLQKLELPDVYVDGKDVAYPKELEKEMDVFFDREWFADLTPMEKQQEQQLHESKDENTAIEHMLSIEKVQREVLKSRLVQPELLNEVQKEAFERSAQKEIREQKMSKEMANLLQNQIRDRQLQQELDR